MPIIIAVPGSQTIRVLYGLGYGTRQIGRVNPIENKLLALTSDGGYNEGNPQVIVIPTTSIAATPGMLVLTVKVYQTALTSKGETYAFPLVKASSIVPVESKRTRRAGVLVKSRVVRVAARRTNKKKKSHSQEVK